MLLFPFQCPQHMDKMRKISGKYIVSVHMRRTNKGAKKDGAHKYRLCFVCSLLLELIFPSHSRRNVKHTLGGLHGVYLYFFMLLDMRLKNCYVHRSFLFI